MGEKEEITVLSYGGCTIHLHDLVTRVATSRVAPDQCPGMPRPCLRDRQRVRIGDRGPDTVHCGRVVHVEP